MGAAVFVIANDFSAINVALPTMERDFHTNINTIQWVVNAYALTFGVLIVTGGRLADMFGRRVAFFLGAAIFAAMSAAGGAAPTETWLIATRALMGIGGALMWPAILGMTYAILPEDKAGLAGGIIIGAAGPRQRGRAADRRRPHRPRQLALDLLPQRADRRLRRRRGLVERPPRRTRGRRPPDRLRRASRRSRSASSSLLIALDQVDDWGWGDPRVIAMLAIAADRDRLLPAARAARRPPRADPAAK